VLCLDGIFTDSFNYFGGLGFSNSTNQTLQVTLFIQLHPFAILIISLSYCFDHSFFFFVYLISRMAEGINDESLLARIRQLEHGMHISLIWLSSNRIL
jgi:hypothetical protein